MQDRETLFNLIYEGRPDLSIEQINLWIKYLLQLKGCKLQSVIAQSIDETKWLKEREKGIGGSEIAAIAGKSPWNTAYQIWLNKTGQYEKLDKKEQSEQARWGNLLEETVAREWAFRNNRQYINIAVILCDEVHPFMFANIDGFTLTDDRETVTGILEIKTTSAYNQEIWENGPIPEYYMCQANWYCRITGLDNYTIACLVGGQRLYAYDFPLDVELVTELRAEAIQFWNYNVKELIEPEIKAGDTELLKARADALEDDGLEAVIVLEDDASENLAEAYCNIREKIKELEKVKEIVYAQLFTLLTTSRSAMTQTHTLTLQKSGRRACEWDLLEENYPEAYATCVRKNISVSLRVK